MMPDEQKSKNSAVYFTTNYCVIEVKAAKAQLDFIQLSESQKYL